MLKRRIEQTLILNFQSFRPYVVFKASEHTGALSVVWGYLVL